MPASIALVFNGVVTSQYNTDLLGISEYTWNFGDGSSVEHSSTPAVPHSFVRAGVYTITLTVHGAFTGDAGGTDSLTITVYEGTCRILSNCRTRKSTVYRQKCAGEDCLV